MSGSEDDDSKKRKKKVSKKIKVPDPVPKRFKVKQGEKRDRKTTEHFSVGDVSPKKSVPIVLHKKGKGKKLGDISYIDSQIVKRTKKDDVLRSFHSLVLGRVNKDTPIKDNLRQFSGLNYSDKEIDRPKYEAKLAKWKVSKIREVLMFLGQEEKGKREEVVDRLMEFIEKPSKAVVEHPFSPVKKRKAPEKDDKVAKKKKMKKRDPNAPKRPTSAYLYFCNHHREECVADHPKQPVTVIAQELAKLWKKASPEEVKKFRKKAKKDKERYEKEKEAYLAKKKKEEEEAESTSSSSSESESKSSSSSSDSE